MCRKTVSCRQANLSRYEIDENNNGLEFNVLTFLAKLNFRKKFDVIMYMISVFVFQNRRM